MVDGLLRLQLENLGSILSERSRGQGVPRLNKFNGQLVPRLYSLVKSP